MSDDTATKFIARLRETRDPNWSDLEHLLQLVWIGEVIAKPEARPAYQEIADVQYQRAAILASARTMGGPDE